MKLKLSKPFFCFLLLFVTTIQSQDLKNNNALTQKSFDELFDLFYESKPNTLKATLYANAYFKKALQEKDTMKMISGKKLLADIKNDDDIYLNFCDSLIEVSNTKPSKNYPTAIHFNKIKFYNVLRESSKAQKELLLANNSLKIKKNDSLKNLLYIQTGLLKTRIDEYEEAIKLYKKAYKYSLKEKITIDSEFLGLPTNISHSYIKLNLIDSANTYCDKALKLYYNLKDTIMIGYSNVTKAEIEFRQKHYKKSIFHYKKAIPVIIDEEYDYLLSFIYTHLGICYDSIKNQKLALKYHIKADSIYTLKHIKVPELISTYNFLIKRAKLKNNLKNQLLYTEKLLEIKEFNLTEKNKLTTTFTNEYDIPNLVKEKEVLQQKIQKEKNYKIVFIALITCFLFLLLYQIRKKKFYRKQFEKIITKKEIALVNSPKKTNQKSSQNISEEIVTTVLNQLALFEKNSDFLNANINLSTLANTFNTNSNYLSKIINQHKNTSFSNYINQLRINYAIEQLKNDAKLRKYKIKAIANEMGYKNVESFSKAFYKYTQLKPSYFIKELEKKLVTNASFIEGN